MHESHPITHAHAARKATARLGLDHQSLSRLTLTLTVEVLAYWMCDSNCRRPLVHHACTPAL